MPMKENNHSSGGEAPFGSSWRRFWSRFRQAPEPSCAHKLYSELVHHARYPLYYDHLGVPDTPEGRFEILALHVGLAIRRLGQGGDEARASAQALFDLMMADLDMNLRELGVGDLSVGKQVKRLASQFYARLDVLNKAFDEDNHELLRPMLATNAYNGGATPSAANLNRMINLLASLERSFSRHDVEDVKSGRIVLPAESALADLDGTGAGTPAEPNDHPSP